MNTIRTITATTAALFSLMCFVSAAFLLGFFPTGRLSRLSYAATVLLAGALLFLLAALPTLRRVQDYKHVPHPKHKRVRAPLPLTILLTLTIAACCGAAIWGIYAFSTIDRPIVLDAGSLEDTDQGRQVHLVDTGLGERVRFEDKWIRAVNGSALLWLGGFPENATVSVTPQPAGIVPIARILSPTQVTGGINLSAGDRTINPRQRSAALIKAYGATRVALNTSMPKELTGNAHIEDGCLRFNGSSTVELAGTSAGAFAFSIDWTPLSNRSANQQLATQAGWQLWQNPTTVRLQLGDLELTDGVSYQIDHGIKAGFFGKRHRATVVYSPDSEGAGFVELYVDGKLAGHRDIHDRAPVPEGTIRLGRSHRKGAGFIGCVHSYSLIAGALPERTAIHANNSGEACTMDGKHAITFPGINATDEGIATVRWTANSSRQNQAIAQLGNWLLRQDRLTLRITPTKRTGKQYRELKIELPNRTEHEAIVVWRVRNNAGYVALAADDQPANLTMLQRLPDYRVTQLSVGGSHEADAYLQGCIHSLTLSSEQPPLTGLATLPGGNGTIVLAGVGELDAVVVAR